MKILITAFENFGGDDYNTSIMISNNLEYDRLILPVAIPNAYDTLVNYLKNKEYDYLILLGMAKSRTKLSVEKGAVNILNFRIPDNLGNMINQKQIEIDNNDVLFTKIDLSKIDEDEDLYISSDAGTYICNYLYYKVLSNIDIPAVFIHIPGVINNKLELKLDETIKKLTQFE